MTLTWLGTNCYWMSPSPGAGSFCRRDACPRSSPRPSLAVADLCNRRHRASGPVRQSRVAQPRRGSGARPCGQRLSSLRSAVAGQTPLTRRSLLDLVSPRSSAIRPDLAHMLALPARSICFAPLAHAGRRRASDWLLIQVPTAPAACRTATRRQTSCSTSTSDSCWPA